MKDLSERKLQAFEEFWASYPRKTGKTMALKAWSKLDVTPRLFKKMIEAVQKQFVGKEKQFIPHASTWLNQARWGDEVIATNTGVAQKLGPVYGDDRYFGCEFDGPEGETYEECAARMENLHPEFKGLISPPDRRLEPWKPE
jgi:hypothetical protein